MPPSPCDKVAVKLASMLFDPARRTTVKDVRIGLGYTAVQLEDGWTGVSLTFHAQAGDGCTVFTGLRPLCGRPAEDLLRLLGSTDVIEAAVGLACANAIANRTDVELNFHSSDVLEAMDLRPDDRVGMVGHFQPLVKPIQQRVKELVVFEQVKQPVRNLRPAAEAAAMLPQCDVALITATAIVNGTIDSLLEAAKICREVVVAGASTPLVPEAFASTRVTMLSGIIVEEPEGLLQVISEGGGMRLFRPFVRKVNVVLNADKQTGQARQNGRANT